MSRPQRECVSKSSRVAGTSAQNPSENIYSYNEGSYVQAQRASNQSIYPYITSPRILNHLAQLLVLSLSVFVTPRSRYPVFMLNFSVCWFRNCFHSPISSLISFGQSALVLDPYLGQYDFVFDLLHFPLAVFARVLVLVLLKILIYCLHLIKLCVRQLVKVRTRGFETRTKRLEEGVQVNLVFESFGAKLSDELIPKLSGDSRNGWSLQRQNKLYYRGEVKDYVPGRDLVIISENYESRDLNAARSFTAYKTVDRKVKPVSGTFPQEALVRRSFPHNPLDGLPVLSKNPPEFIPTQHMTLERMKILEINSTGFLWPEEEKLFQHVMVLNEKALAFEETDHGTLHEDYFSPYIMPTVPHIPWEEKNIPIPPGIKEQVIELLKHKMDAGVYEHCQSAYRSKWFCVLKKNGKLRIVHDLQALNAISIRDAGGPPILDDFVEPFAG